MAINELNPESPDNGLITVTAKGIKNLTGLMTSILDESNRRNNLRERMSEIDRAYNRYKSLEQEANPAKARESYGTKICGQVASTVVNPIVVSQVQSMVAWWAETYLSGYPIFPVVSVPDHKDLAEALEGIIQDHLELSGSVPELLKMFYDGAKYNLMFPIVSWEPIAEYSPTKELTDMTLDASTNVFDTRTEINFIKRVDPYNAHWDGRCPRITDVDTKGRHIGYTEVMPHVAVLQLLEELSASNKLLGSYDNVVEKLNSLPTRESTDYHVPNMHTDMHGGDERGGTNWASIFEEHYTSSGMAHGKDYYESLELYDRYYNVHRMFVRIVPKHFGLIVDNANRLGIWEVVMINRSLIVSARPITGQYGRFPMFAAHAIEDGQNLNTHSYAEQAIPLQDVTTRMFNVRLAAMNRGVQDRAIYDPKYLRPEDVNNPFPSSKIPLRPTASLEVSIASVYHQIPFDARPTEGIISDAMMLTDWQKELSGMNNATKGQFTKGNRTLGEFGTIMDMAMNRLMLPNIVIHHRLMSKIKDAIKLNILQNGANTTIISPRTRSPIEVDIQKMQKEQLRFDIGDGYLPKGKMSNPELLQGIMQMIAQTEGLSQQLAPQLPAMLAHIAQLGGIRGFDRYAQAAVPQAEINAEAMITTMQAMQAKIEELTQQQAATQDQVSQVEANQLNASTEDRV